MTKFTELNSKEMNKVNGGSVSIVGPALGPVILASYLISKLFK
ncbi:bacteriocin [Ruminococcus sp.]|jgi:bacteriocin-like protein|nr:bacteriocin [Ruminococcus sp.]